VNQPDVDYRLIEHHSAGATTSDLANHDQDAFASIDELLRLPTKLIEQIAKFRDPV
jgi:hypothetical protein